MRRGCFPSVLLPQTVTRDEHLLRKEMECIGGQAQALVTSPPLGRDPGSGLPSSLQTAWNSTPSPLMYFINCNDVPSEKDSKHCRMNC